MAEIDPPPLETTAAPTAFSRGFSLHRLAMLLALVVFGWLIVTQAIPRLFMVKKTPDTVVTIDDAPLMVEEAATTPNSSETAEPAPEEDRLLALEARIAKLEEHPAGAAEVEAKQQALESKLDALEAQLTAAKAELQQEMVVGQKQGWRRVALLDAVSELSRAVESGESLQPALAQLDALAEASLSEPFSALKSLAKMPLSTERQLVERFPKLADEALFPIASGANIWEKTKASLKRLVRIRKVGEQAGDSDEAILARAERADRLTVAVAELQKLSPPAAAVFEEWLEQARRLTEAREQIAELNRRVRGSAASGTAPSGPAPGSPAPSEP